MAQDRVAVRGAGAVISFPEEYDVWLEFLEHADPDAYTLFQQAADVTLP